MRVLKIKMNNFIMSPKQAEMFKYANARCNIFDGAVRSGKSQGGFFLLPKRVKQFKDTKGYFTLCGKTEKTIVRNTIIPLQELYGTQYISDLNYKKGEVYIFGERFLSSSARIFPLILASSSFTRACAALAGASISTGIGFGFGESVS